jgi:hypothetical protein
VIIGYTPFNDNYHVKNPRSGHYPWPVASDILE